MRISATATAGRLGRVTLAAACALGIAGLASLAAAQAPTVTARDAWVREPSPSNSNAALFVVLENTGTDKRAVLSAASDAAARVELHEMKMDGAMMRMSPVKQIDVPAKGTVELKPGGLHVMLFDLTKRPAAGDSVVVTFTLDNGSKVPVTATVRKQESRQ